jgi:hypothetical protein
MLQKHRLANNISLQDQANNIVIDYKKKKSGEATYLHTRDVINTYEKLHFVYSIRLVAAILPDFYSKLYFISYITSFKYLD